MAEVYREGSVELVALMTALGAEFVKAAGELVVADPKSRSKPSSSGAGSPGFNPNPVKSLRSIRHRIRQGFYRSIAAEGVNRRPVGVR
jgi:hypothetical protein